MSTFKSFGPSLSNMLKEIFDNIMKFRSKTFLRTYCKADLLYYFANLGREKFWQWDWNFELIEMNALFWFRNVIVLRSHEGDILITIWHKSNGIKTCLKQDRKSMITWNFLSLFLPICQFLQYWYSIFTNTSGCTTTKLQ